MGEERNKKEMPLSLKERMIKRSNEIKGAVDKELKELVIPTTVELLARCIHSNRFTVQKYVLQIIEEEKYKIAVERVGGYDIIFKKCNCKQHKSDDVAGEQKARVEKKTEVSV